MDGATICVQPGTSTELAVSDYFRLHNMKFTPILIQDLAEIQGAFLSGRCDAYSTDASALATFCQACLEALTLLAVLAVGPLSLIGSLVMVLLLMLPKTLN